jgi:DNA topoisomerase-1
MPKIEAALETSDEAKVLYLIDKTGFRIGSDNETGAKVKAYGASTLTSDHVRVNGNKVTFEFVGKKGVKQSQTIDDPKIAAMVKGKQGRLFNTNDSKVRDYLKNISGKKDFKVKDFRTYVATTTALEASDRLPPPSDKPMTAKEKATKIMDVAKEVSRKLGNTPVMARDSYIDPMVFDRYEVVG